MTQRITFYPDVEKLRREAYPRLELQLEMIWRVLDEIGNGQLRPPEAQAMLDRIKAVQAKYPRQ